MPAPDYLPRPDAAFDAWQLNFVEYALAHEDELGIDKAEAELLEQASSDFNKALGDVAQKRAALAAALETKDQSRAALAAMIRGLARRIQNLPGMDNATRAALGLTVPDSVPTPAAAPDAAPLVRVEAVRKLCHKLDIRSAATPERRARPRGIIGAHVFVALTAPGENPPPDMAAWKFHGLASRSPFDITLPGESVGRVAHYALRWVNAKGQTGPWSNTAAATVAG